MGIGYLDDSAGRNGALAYELVDELGQRACALAGDVCKWEDMDRVVHEAQERFGGVDILVSNAGILRDRTVKKMTPEEWNSVINTNLSGVFHACRAAAAVMNDGGRIVNVASLAAVMGFFGQANYASAKAGVIALTKVLSKELASRQITVNAVAPGVVLTEMGKSIPEASRQPMLTQIPLRRFAEPAEVANGIAFLVSDLASYVTGQTLHINGGWWG